MNMIQEKVIDCKEFEEKLYAEMCKIGCELYREALSAWDYELHKVRDKSIYRDKGKRKTMLKTLMGEVEYSRHVYTFVDENGRVGTVYLLDKAIGREYSGFFSEAIIERISSSICEMTFRATANEISSLTGQTISHTAVWNVTQQLGEQIDEVEVEKAAIAQQNNGLGELETKLLFEEQDGIYLHLQGKSRKKHGKSKEMKLAIAYDGAVESGKNRYELTNKVACANFESAGKFRRRKEGVIADVYNVYEVEMRVLNGDGANWIKKSADFDTIYQLDPFHRNRAILRAAPDEPARVEMLKLLYTKRIDELLTYIDALANSVEDEEIEIKLRELHKYFSNNFDGLVAYNQRGIELPKPPKGKGYRTLGAMESNVFSIIGNRMKGRRKSWSVNGGNNLARLLCLKHTGKLYKTVSSLSSQMPEKYAEEVITLSSTKMRMKVGNGWNGFRKATVPPSQKWLKDMTAMIPFSEMRQLRHYL